MPKLSQLRRNTGTVTIPTDGGEPLVIEFRKGFVSPSLADRLTGFEGMTQAARLGVLVEMVKSAVIAWNLTDDDGKPLPVTTEALAAIDSGALDSIAVAIQGAMAVDPTNGVSSSDSSPAVESSDATPTGTAS